MWRTPPGVPRRHPGRRPHPFRNARAARLAAVAIALWPSFAAAQAIIAPGGRTLFNQQFLVRTFTRIQRQAPPEGGRGTQSYLQPVALVYGFAPGWHTTAVVPFRAGGGPDGIGDARFFVKYDGLIKRNEPGGLTRLSAEFGVQVPTGSKDLTTGAETYLADLVFLKASKQRHIVADVQYEAATRNSDGIAVGNRALFDVAFSYLFVPENAKSRDDAPRGLDRIAPHGIFGILEFNAEVRNRTRTHTGALSDSGGGLLYVAPGIQYFVKRNVILELSAPVPVVRALNGNQVRPRTGVILGFRYVL